MTKSMSSALTLIALILQSISSAAMAAGTCSVSALDTVAGLGTEVTVTSCSSGLTTTLIVQSPDNQNYTQQITLDGSGNASTLVPSQYTETAGIYNVSVAGKTTTFTVLSDRADDAQSSLIVSPQRILANGKDTATVTAILRDRNGNPVSGRPLALIASRLTDEIAAQSTKTDASGRFLWTIRSTENGVSSLIVYDIAAGRQMKLRAELTVGQNTFSSAFKATLSNLGQGGDAPVAADLTSEVIDHFELSLPQNATNVKANDLFGITVRAMRGTEVARGYIGSLTVRSSDPDAVLPKQGLDPREPAAGHIDMRGVDQGDRNVPLAFMLRNGGSQTIEVTDDTDPSITGKITLNVSRTGSVDKNGITILDPLDRSTIKGGPVLLQGRAPSLINLRVKGGSEQISGESDQEGVFRISVPINAADKEVTLFVASENGTYESAPVHILIDNAAPSIQTITLDPPEAKSGQQTKITVQSEPNLSEVNAVVNQATITLQSASGGTYTGMLSAPLGEGTYDITVNAKDAAGNASALLTKWRVTSAKLPIVQNVKAESQQGAVALSWNAVEGVNVREYKIYIALQEDPNNILYSIGTKKPVTSAIIRDLPLGKNYIFSMTVVATDGTESPEKSAAATASPIGFSLKASPGKDSLQLTWTTMPSLPLDHYILQYGTLSGQYTERRTINGQATTTVLRDLLGGVTYEVKLTPVAVTGKEMASMAAIARGTPTSDGFTAGGNDPVPTDIIGHSGAPIDPSPSPSLDHVPSNTESGIPSMAAGLLLITAFGIGLYVRRARREKQRIDAFLRAMQERYLS